MRDSSENQVKAEQRSHNVRQVLCSVVVALCLLLIVKIITSALAVLELKNSIDAAVALMASPEASDEQTTATLDRLVAASERVFGEAEPLAPVIGLFGADGCVLKRAINVGSRALPVLANFTALAAPALHTIHSAQPNEIPVAALRSAWNPANAEAARKAIVGLETIPPCDNPSPRFAALQSAADGMLFISEFTFALPWNDLLSDSKHWLILLNNSDELRATGGFTTAFVDVSISNGTLTWRFENSYSVDNFDRMSYHPLPPDPMRDFMGIQYWVFRDSNWSPDHPTAAKVAARIYALDRGVAMPDGVVTVNMSGMTTLARYLPTLNINGETFSENTALDGLRAAWNEDAPTLNSYVPERKDFLINYAVTLADAVAHQTSILEKARLGLALQDMLVRRDIMIDAFDPATNAIFAQQRYDGSLEQTRADYLIVVDTDLGYNKVTPRIQRHIQYTVDLDKHTARAEMTYTNTNLIPVDCTVWHYHWVKGAQVLNPVPTYADRMTACFWDYVRIFMPMGSRVNSFHSYSYPGNWFAFTDVPYTERIDAWHEGAYDGVGTMLVLPVNSTRDIWFQYSLPPQIVQTEAGTSTYHLYLQKQAGSTDADVTFSVKLPSNTRLVSPPLTTLTAAQIDAQSEMITITGKLEFDAEFTIRYQPR